MRTHEEHWGGHLSHLRGRDGGHDHLRIEGYGRHEVRSQGPRLRVPDAQRTRTCRNRPAEDVNRLDDDLKIHFDQQCTEIRSRV